MTEFERAKAWRQRIGWTMDELSERTGYSKSAISWFERGQAPPARGSFAPRPLNPYSWHRYRRICHSVAVEHARGKPFDWN